MSVLGYFDGPSSVPTFDPPLDAPCVVCWRAMKPPRVTVSLLREGDARSWFFRAHKGCWDCLTPEERWRYESSVVDR